MIIDVSLKGSAVNFSHVIRTKEKFDEGNVKTWKGLKNLTKRKREVDIRTREEFMDSKRSRVDDAINNFNLIAFHAHEAHRTKNAMKRSYPNLTAKPVNRTMNR